MQREHPLVGHDQNWDDVGASWDDIQRDDDEEGDGVRWADDAEGPAYLLRQGYAGASIDRTMREDIGPMGELSTYGQPSLRTDIHLDEDVETVMGHESPSSASGTATAVGDVEAIDLPGVPADTSSNSSDGSPIEKLGAALEAIRMDRGRNRVPTPIQGNGPTPTVDW